MKKVLFLCTGNSCRSQMAEAWTRHLLGDVVEVHSAGTDPKPVNGYAEMVMREAGIDISLQTSKTVDDVNSILFDWVITVCDNAMNSCPVFPQKTNVLHRGFDDPPELAKQFEDLEDILEPYRRVRDEIKNFVETLPERLSLSPSDR